MWIQSCKCSQNSHALHLTLSLARSSPLKLSDPDHRARYAFVGFESSLDTSSLYLSLTNCLSLRISLSTMVDNGPDIASYMGQVVLQPASPTLNGIPSELILEIHRLASMNQVMPSRLSDVSKRFQKLLSGASTRKFRVWDFDEKPGPPSVERFMLVNNPEAMLWRDALA